MTAVTRDSGHRKAAGYAKGVSQLYPENCQEQQMLQTGNINLAFQEPENPWLIFCLVGVFLGGGASLEAEKALMVQMSHSSLSVVVAN